MAYITNTDIQERVGAAAYLQLADDNLDGVADAVVVDEARLGAEGEVNGYLARRYQVPIDVTARPELAGVLASITLDLAELRLRARRPPVPQPMLDAGRQAIDWLQRVADGRIDLPAAAELPANPSHGLTAKTRGAKRVLSRDELADF